MRNNKQQTRNKVSAAVESVDRKIAKAERELFKVPRGSQAYETRLLELHKLRQKRAQLFKGVRS